MCTHSLSLLYIYAAAIPVETGDSVSGTLEKEDVVHYEFEIPPHGLSLNVCVSEGEIVVYGSTLVPNANPALNDFMLLVGADSCMNVTVDSSEDSELDSSLFVSLEGVDILSEFDIAISAIEPPVETEDNNERGSGEPDISYPKEGLLHFLTVLCTNLKSFLFAEENCSGFSCVFIVVLILVSVTVFVTLVTACAVCLALLLRKKKRRKKRKKRNQVGVADDQELLEPELSCSKHSYSLQFIEPPPNY